MKSVISMGAAMLALAVSGGASVAAEAPLMTLLIKPGKVDAATSRGDIDVTMTIPGVNAPAGQPFLSMDLFTPGLAHPQVMQGLTVSDAAGVVPLTAAADPRGVTRWVPARAIQGVATVKYRLLAENIPAL